MGTRNLIIIYYKGQYLVAQYGQWDGYPEGQGARILAFFNKDPNNLQALKDKMHLVYEPTKDELDRIYDEDERLSYQEQMSGNWDPSRSLINSQYPSLGRDAGAKILDMIIAAEGEKKVPVSLYLEFAADFLFCEWTYVIDLDTDKLEVYSGAEQKEGARSRRFTELWTNDDKHKNEGLAGRAQVPRMLGDFSLTKLPDQTQFVTYFNEILKDEEDED